MFFVEVITRTGKLCESFATYEEARRRIDSLAPESIVGLPFIFQELADGSQRLVRDDGKPLQWHHVLHDPPAADDQPITLADVPPGFLGTIKPRLISEAEPEEDPPLPLA
jgi:hypothetical protein